MADDNIRNSAMQFLLSNSQPKVSSTKETPSYTLYEEKDNSTQENKKDLLLRSWLH